MNEQECNKCKVVKPLDAFHRDNTRESGRMTTCKQCREQHYQENREKAIERGKQHYQDNREMKLVYQNEYNRKNKKERREYIRNRKKNDPAFALRHTISKRINEMLKSNNGSKKGESIMKYLPYTKEQLKEHIEKQFKPGMSWDNRSEWHIDHIYPHSLLPYDSMDHSNFQKCWALENLQPLWAKENIKKGSKILDEE